MSILKRYCFFFLLISNIIAVAQPYNCPEIDAGIAFITEGTQLTVSPGITEHTGCVGDPTGGITLEYGVTIAPIEKTKYTVEVRDLSGVLVRAAIGHSGDEFNFQNLPVDDYNVIIRYTDFVPTGNCIDTVRVDKSAFNEPTNPFSLDSVFITDATCGNNGSIEFFYSGGDTTANISFITISSPTGESLAVAEDTVTGGFLINQLIGGNYDFGIEDQKGCRIDLTDAPMPPIIKYDPVSGDIIDATLTNINIVQYDTFNIMATAVPSLIELGDSSMLGFDILSTNGFPITFVEWFPDDRFSTASNVNEENPFVKPCGDFEYTVIVRDSANCTDTGRVTIEVNGRFDPFIPTAFTPNGTGPAENEELRVFGIGIDSSGIKVWDRKGALIFVSEENGQGWNGRIGGGNGAEANTGLYLYEAVVNSICGETLVKRGETMLFR